MTTYAYDAVGNLTATTNPDGFTTQYVYDDLNRQIETIQPNPITGMAGGGPTTFTTYDNDGNVISTTDADGNTTEYFYNAQNEQTETIEPNPTTGLAGAGPTTYAAYDLDGEVTSTTDAKGNVTTYGYDGDGRQTSVTQPAPKAGLAPLVSSTTYDNAGNVTSSTDPDGNTTYYEYDGLERQVAVVLPNPTSSAAYAPGTATTYVYDLDDELIATTDPMGRTTTYGYNHLGEQTSVTQPSATGNGTGPVSTTAYDLDGNVILQTDPNGATTSYVYDSLGLPIETITPSPTGSGTTTSYATYDAAGQMLTSTDPLGEVTSYLYDALGRLEEETAPSSSPGGARAIDSYEYDPNGNLLAMIVFVATPWQNPNNPFDVNGDGVVNAEDAILINTALNVGIPGLQAGGGTLPTLPPGATPAEYYDVLGNGTLSPAAGLAIINYLNDPEVNPIPSLIQQETTYAYDHLGRQTSQTDPDGDVTSYTYDANGNQTSLTDPDGNTTTFSYDGLNRLVGQSRTTYENADNPAVAVSESFSYDGDGNLTSQTNYDNQTIYYTYDNLNRQTQELWDSPTSPSATFTYTYDADGELTSAAAPTNTITEGYNNLGQLTSDQTSGNGYTAPVTIANGYDPDGNRTSSSLSFGATADYTNTYQYNALDEETSVTQTGSIGGNAVAPKRVDMTYNADGQFASIDTYADLAATQNVVSSVYGYDGAGNLTSLTDTAQGNTLAGYTWKYNPLGEITTFSSSQYANENLGYTYDATGQLTGATDANNPSANESYTYDANGNRTVSVTPSPTGEGGGEGSVSATYTTGANNEMVSDGTYTYQYDGEGNLIQQTAIVGTAYTTYAYDDRQELTTVTSYAAPGEVTQTVAYTYDAFGRRISETVAITGGTTTETKFVYDGQAIVATLDGTNALTNRYLNGPATDQVFADEQFVPTATGQMPTTSGTVIYPLVDNLGTDRDLVEYDETTGLTSVVDHIAYQTYGAVTNQTNTAVDYLFGYTGLVLDQATGENVSATRIYRPADGDWSQNDRDGFGAGQANLGEYVGNSPTNGIDPTGWYLVAVDGTDSYSFLGPWRGEGAKGIEAHTPTGAWRSHIRNFYNDYKGHAIYLSGPNTMGTNTQSIIDRAYVVLREYLKKNPTECIDMVGHSRGAYIVMEVARELQNSASSYPGETKTVRFMGLYDPVKMQPGPMLAAGSGSQTVSTNVEHVFAVISDPGFTKGYVPLTRSRWWWNRLDSGVENPNETKYTESLIAGSHAALGGAPGEAGALDFVGQITYSLTQEIMASRAADFQLRTAAIKDGVPLSTANDVQQIPTPGEIEAENDTQGRNAADAIFMGKF